MLRSLKRNDARCDYLYGPISLIEEIMVTCLPNSGAGWFICQGGRWDS